MMDNRRNFLKNVLMVIAIFLLPKILRPSNAEIEEEMVDIEFIINKWVYVGGVDPYKEDDHTSPAATFIYKMKKNDADKLVAEYHSRTITA